MVVVVVVPATRTLRMFCRELAIEISLVSFGSSQTLPRPHLRTDDASRFCSLRDTMIATVERE